MVVVMWRIALRVNCVRKGEECEGGQGGDRGLKAVDPNKGAVMCALGERGFL